MTHGYHLQRVAAHPLFPIVCCQASAVDVGEIIVYRRILSSLERQRVEAYLSTKWTVAMTVPPDVSTPLSIANGTFTIDVFNSQFVQQQLKAMNPRAIAYVQRSVTVDIDTAVVITLSVKLLKVRQAAVPACCY